MINKSPGVSTLGLIFLSKTFGKRVRKSYICKHISKTEFMKKKKRNGKKKPRVMPGFENFVLYNYKAKKVSQPINSKK